MIEGPFANGRDKESSHILIMGQHEGVRFLIQWLNVYWSLFGFLGVFFFYLIFFLYFYFFQLYIICFKKKDETNLFHFKNLIVIWTNELHVILKLTNLLTTNASLNGHSKSIATNKMNQDQKQ